VPLEFQWLDTDYEKPDLYFPETHAATVSGTDMDNAVGIIASSKWPVVVAGRGAMAPEARAAILRFAERIEAPLATTLRGKGLFSGDPFDLGICGTLSNPVALDTITQSDCLIVFGASLNKYTAGEGGLTRGKRIVHVNPEASQIGRFTPVQAGVVGDPGLVADAMVALLNEAEIPGSGARTEDLRKRIAEYDGQPPARATPRPGTVDIIEMLQALNASFPADRVYVTDGGRFVLSGWREIDVDKPQNFVSTLGFASIGLGLGEAIGAAVAAEGQPTLLLTGDGGLMLAGLSELTTAVREQLDIVIVVCNDGSYGAEHRQFQAKNMDPGLSLLTWPDFAPVAQAFGADAVTVRNREDLQDAMAGLPKRDRKRPLLIDVKLDPDLIRDH
jgi:thiamine pyrophosphate-dependent acetolactate synthase large subunit-like protein